MECDWRLMNRPGTIVATQIKATINMVNPTRKSIDIRAESFVIG
jgi:hypothetical protein